MGVLYVVATPIGNLEDITIRAIKTLLTVPVVACEDTRRTGQLIKILKERYAEKLDVLNETATRFISIRDWNEADSIEKMLVALSQEDVALVSDAGTPLISDPGYKIVKAVREAGYSVSPIPGASAMTTAISAAGLPTNRFVFWGFWQNKYELLSKATNIFYESPLRLKKTIEFIKQKYPEAQIIEARELTKIHEFIGQVNTGNNKGEVTVLVYID